MNRAVRPERMRRPFVSLPGGAGLCVGRRPLQFQFQFQFQIQINGYGFCDLNSKFEIEIELIR
jgi:hypothetical protein